MEQNADCSTCKHHQKQPRAKPTGWQSGRHFELADETQDVFRCGAPAGPHAGAEVGLLPVHCESYETGAAAPLPQTIQSAYDLWKARMDARREG